MSIHRRRAVCALIAGPMAWAQAATIRPKATSSPLPVHAADRLEALQADPTLAGERVYRADVYAPDGPPGAAPLFVYTRHVQTVGPSQSASHLTYLPGGELIIEECVLLSRDGTLQRFDVANRQTGLAGSAVLDAQQRRLLLDQPGTAMSTIEHVTAPVVAGPNLHAHILRHWNALSGGQRLKVRLVALERMETIGFDLQLIASANDHSTFQITPSQWLYRLAVSPLRVVFDHATRRVTRYEGRVPPKRELADRRVDLDAVVHYHWDTDHYR